MQGLRALFPFKTAADRAAADQPRPAKSPARAPRKADLAPSESAAPRHAADGARAGSRDNRLGKCHTEGTAGGEHR